LYVQRKTKTFEIEQEVHKVFFANVITSLTQLDQMRIEKQNIPSPQKSKVASRFRNHSSDIDVLTRKLTTLSSDRSALFGARYTDDPALESGGGDVHLEQRQQLLHGTERLERSSGRLRESQRIALETETIGANTLADLGRQRETIVHTRQTLGESEGYTDRSIKTLRGMARR
jgi:vesicle transport through interaction with t-SNAREs protein 1